VPQLGELPGSDLGLERVGAEGVVGLQRHVALSCPVSTICRQSTQKDRERLREDGRETVER
jgi:hypothetical protein